MLAGIVDNEIYIKKESVRRFEIGRDKKKTTRTSVSHAEEREKKEVAQFMLMSYWKFFFSSASGLFFCYSEDLFNERKTRDVEGMGDYN